MSGQQGRQQAATFICPPASSFPDSFVPCIISPARQGCCAKVTRATKRIRCIGLPYLKNLSLFIMESENSYRWCKMPINDLLKYSKVSPEQADRLNHAFTYTLKSLVG